MRARAALPWLARILALAAIGVAIALFAMCSGPGRAITDRALGDTPEQRVAAFVAAVSRADAVAAGRSWNAGSAWLEARHRSWTEQLIAASPRPSARIERVEWWWICCAAVEPAASRDKATFARMWVVLELAAGPRMLVVDVSALDHQPMFDGLPAREWRIVDVHEDPPPPMPRGG
ncbi:MAG TPA: hypothetical protein VFM93_12230 [Candidatus Limnocylindria bacterium]|nr:hypothetical protein [Candidatus Limnocylindria bacterium]